MHDSSWVLKRRRSIVTADVRPQLLERLLVDGHHVVEARGGWQGLGDATRGVDPVILGIGDRRIEVHFRQLQAGSCIDQPHRPALPVDGTHQNKSRHRFDQFRLFGFRNHHIHMWSHGLQQRLHVYCADVEAGHDGYTGGEPNSTIGFEVDEMSWASGLWVPVELSYIELN